MKKLTDSNLVIVCFLLFYLSSCGAYYVPNTQEVPMFTAKNQGRANIGFALFPEGSKAFKYSGSYSFSDHFGATANMFFVSESDGHLKNYHGIDLKGTSAGLGLIHFMPLDEKHVFETTLGFAGGNAKNGSLTLDNATIEDKLNFVNVYIQPSLGLVKRRFEFVLSLKYNIHTYTNLNLTMVEHYEAQLVNQGAFGKKYYGYPINKTFHFIEPALTMKVGWESFKISLQVVPSFLLGDIDIDRENFNANIGLHYQFGKK